MSAHGSAERDLIDGIDEFGHIAVAYYFQFFISNVYLQVSGDEGSRKHHFLRVLTDIDKAPRSGQAGTEAAHVEIAGPVSLRQT